MKRIITVFAVLIALLAVSEYWIQHARQEERRLRSTLRPLIDASAEIVPERVRAIRIHAGGSPQEWTYVKKASYWRFPGHFDAYVRADRVEFLLRAILQSMGTFLTTESEDLRPYGLAPPQRVTVSLLDAQGPRLLEVQLGKGVTGAASGESYIRKSSADTILHWHANPLHALDPGNPPMIDPVVLPKALARSSLSSIKFENGVSSTGEAASAVTMLRRVEVAADGDNPAALLARRSNPTIAWLATVDGREDTCLNTGVSAYSSFLSSLRYRRVHDPNKGGYGFVDGRRLALIADDGEVDVLEIGSSASRQTVYVRNRTAGMVFSVDQSAVDLLFPKAEFLFEPLPDPSPYGRAVVPIR